MVWDKFRVQFGDLAEVLSLTGGAAIQFVKVRLTTTVLLVVATSVLTGLGPVALKLIVDEFSRPESSAAISVSLLIIIYVVSQWLARSVTEVRGFVYARAERRMSRILTEKLFGHVLRLPLRFHLDRQTGAVSQSIANGLQGCQIVLYVLVFNLLPVAVELGTVVLVLIRLNHPAFLELFCSAIVCYIFVFLYAARSTKKAARRASAAQVDAMAVMTDGLLSYEIVKYFAAEYVMQEKVNGVLARMEDECIGFSRQAAVNGFYVAAVYAIFLSITVLSAAHEVRLERMSIGTFVLLNTYMSQIVRPVETLGYAVQNLSQGLAYLDRVAELLRQESDDLAQGEGTPLMGPGRLDFENVSASYAGRTVLAAVSFRLSAGRTLGIVGASGSGKSTLVRLVTRLVEPCAGRILLDGVPISSLALSRLRESIAVVPQDTVLFNDTIGNNISFGKRGSSQHEVEEAARLAQLHEFITSLPDGYETRVGERGVQLSGGEKQRVAIARAAIKRPKLYVFDEATSSLDTRTECEILRNLREISRHSTTLMIAHRLSSVVHADEILVLDSGGIVERGTHRSLLSENNLYALLWRAQTDGDAYHPDESRQFRRQDRSG